MLTSFTVLLIIWLISVNSLVFMTAQLSLPYYGVCGKYVDKISQSRNKSTTLKLTKTKNKKHLSREEFELLMTRLGMNYNYETFLITVETKNQLNTIKILIASSIFFMFGLSYGGVLIGILFGLVFFIPFKVLTAINYKEVLMKKERELKKEILMELPRFVSSYIYTPKEYSLEMFLKSYLQNAGALKVDLTILLSDIQTYGYKQALNLFSQRVDSNSLSKSIDLSYLTIFVNKIILITSKGEVDTIRNSLLNIEQEIRKDIQIQRTKDLKRTQTRSYLITMSLLVVWILMYIIPLIIMAPTFLKF